MERAVLKKILNKGRAFRKYPSQVEVWYQTEVGDFLVIQLNNSNRKISFHNERIIGNSNIMDEFGISYLDMTEIDLVWDKFRICPHILFTRDPLKFNNIHWENGNELLWAV